MTRPSVSVLETRAEPLGEAFDLLAAYTPPLGVLFERRDVGVAGSSGLVIGTNDLRSFPDLLQDLGGSLPRGTDVPAVAVGSVGFAARSDRHAHQLTIPRRAVCRCADGRAWRIDATFPGRPAPEPPPLEGVIGRAPSTAFGSLREVPPLERYEEIVRDAVGRIHRGPLRKAVLARTIEVSADRELDPRLLAHRLRAVDPDSYAFAVPTGDGVLVGASPELLVSRRGTEVRANPLAGSAPRSGDRGEDRANAEGLLASAKDRREHAIVVDAVAATLRPLCAELTWDPEPVLRETPNVWHLSTRFVGVLRQPAPSALELVAALHPTPAVAGTPRDVALDVIAELEPFERGRYGGAVGWVDANGDGEWAIAIRCAELRGDRAILYAGAGIVADSDPAAEAEETERKFRAFLDSLRWG